MKFLQEMIAKKRAQHDDADAPAADPLPSLGADGFVQDELPHAVSHAALGAAAGAATGAVAEDAGDDEDLFDDGSYDWNVGGEDAMLSAVAQANAEAEEPEEESEAAETMEAIDTEEVVSEEADAEDEPVEDDAADLFAEDAPVDDETEEDDESDVSVATSLVLKDIVARSQTDAQGEAAAADGPSAETDMADAPQSSLEQSVQKIRVQRKMWDMEAESEGNASEEVAAAEEPDLPAEEPPAPVVAPAPAAAPRLRAQMPADGSPPAPSSRRGGRVKTRLLGFHKEDAPADPVAAQAPAAAAQIDPQFPVGWMVVTEGPGRGASFTLTAGASKIGRGEDQAIRLDYGDTSISRDNHAAVAFDGEQRTFYIGHGGKANLVRLNDMPVLSTEPLADGDEIRIGETTLVFVAFCGPDFSWDDDGDEESRYAAAE